MIKKIMEKVNKYYNIYIRRDPTKRYEAMIMDKLLNEQFERKNEFEKEISYIKARGGWRYTHINIGKSIYQMKKM